MSQRQLELEPRLCRCGSVMDRPRPARLCRNCQVMNHLASQCKRDVKKTEVSFKDWLATPILKESQ